MSWFIRLLKWTDCLFCRLSMWCRWLWPLMGVVLCLRAAPGLGLIALSILAGYLLWTPGGAGSSNHGTASWATAADLLKAGCLFQESGVYIGNAVGLKLPRLAGLRYLLFAPLNRSREIESLLSGKSSLVTRVPDTYPTVAVFGSSGSGKTTSFAIPILLRCMGAMIVLDTKGELSKLTARERWAKFGSRVIVIDPFDVTEFQSARFNPLAQCSEDPTRIVDECRRLANAIVVRSENESDRFWADSAVTVITCTLVFLVTEARKEEASLSRARDILTNPRLVDQMLDIMLASDKCFGLSKRLAGEVRGLEGKVKMSVFAVANSHMAFLDSIPVASVLSETTFDPHELLTSNPTVYLSLPMDRVTELASVQRVILTSLINMVFAAGEDPARRVHLLLDEAATLNSMDALYTSVNYGRSYGIRSVYLFQASSQVTRCFPESQKDDFFGSAAAIYAGTNDYETGKQVSDWMGQRTVASVTSQTGSNEGGSTSENIGDMSRNRNWGASDSSSVSETGRMLLRPEEVLQLPRHLAIALVPGVPPILVEKVPYFAKTRRRLLRKAVRLATDVGFVALSLVFLLPLIWACTLGANHPIVVHQIRLVQRMLFGS